MAAFPMFPGTGAGPTAPPLAMASPAGGGSMAPPAALVLPASVGSENLASMPRIAARMNPSSFNQAPQMSIMRMAGQLIQLDGQGSLGLKCSEGGVVNLSSGGIAPSLGGLLNHKVEIIGSKLQDGNITAACALPLTADCELGLWDDFVKLSNDPRLRHLFEPLES
eukprot:TRINITY_DN26713_c0_g1_i1.p1 TRINITY_DN26713_c0_g1~~TRINITY_DN26713_c0_g1_i1.p1  ORF type:complete len:166 (-),score=26.80 TRINITY_DN26713_c0_g1_i1:224-721(-)